MTEPKSLQDLDHVSLFKNQIYTKLFTATQRGVKTLKVNSVLLGALISAITKSGKCFIH